MAWTAVVIGDDHTVSCAVPGPFPLRYQVSAGRADAVQLPVGTGSGESDGNETGTGRAMVVRFAPHIPLAREDSSIRTKRPVSIYPPSGVVRRLEGL